MKPFAHLVKKNIFDVVCVLMIFLLAVEVFHLKNKIIFLEEINKKSLELETRILRIMNQVLGNPIHGFDEQIKKAREGK